MSCAVGLDVELVEKHITRDEKARDSLHCPYDEDRVSKPYLSIRALRRPSANLLLRSVNQCLIWFVGCRWPTASHARYKVCQSTC
jgi:hypothetical protein